MDVISLLLKTYAYEDGACVGPMTVKEGIIMRPDGSVEDICSSILKVDASLRARYHMTAALSGTRRFGPHSYNAREPVRVQQPPPDTSTTDIASAIDDFLGGYVPEEAAQPSNFEESMKHIQSPTRQQPAPLLPEFPFEHEMAASMRGLDPLATPFSPFSPMLTDGGGGDEEWRAPSFEDDYGSPPGGRYFGHCENEAPPPAAAAGAPCYYVPGGRVEGAGPKVAPVRYGSYPHEQPRHQEHSQECGSLHRQHHHHHQEHQHHGYRNQDEQPRSAQDHGTWKVRPFSGRRTQLSSASAPFVPMHMRGGLSSAPPAPATSFPFPPPAYLLSGEGCGGAHSARPFGRQRAGAAAPATAWPAESAKFAPHPYQDAAYRARTGANRPSILRPRN